MHYGPIKEGHGTIKEEAKAGSEMQPIHLTCFKCKRP
jgi:hypothetical protein